MIKYHNDLIQGSPEWIDARRGILTASEMKHIITPAKLAYAQNDKERAHLFELAAQRITGYVEPHYISSDMLRGMDDELDAKRYYEDNYERVTDMGFITNDKFGFVLGYSPDGLVGDDGLIECKGRRARFQLETILSGVIPSEYLIQVQTGLLVSERKWCDFISFCGGLPMLTLRIDADSRIQEAIVAAATTFHEKLDAQLKYYAEKLADKSNRLVPTERRVDQELMA
jgi:predicted phage-related endonuclease